MVDLATLQIVSYIVGYLSVALGVVYYINNLREGNKNRRITTTTTLLQTLVSHETLKIEGELYLMQWKD